MGEAELKVTLVIARQTIGWQKEKDKLSVTQLMEKTGLSRQGVLNGIDAGVARGTITREPISNTFYYSLSVNEVDRSTEKTGLPSRPKSVYQVDRNEQKTVYLVDPQKKDLKEKKERGEKDLDGSSAPTSSTTQAPPSKTGDPYMDIAWAKHNGNKRFLSRRQTALMAIQSELPDLKLTPEQFTALVDCHLTEKGTKVLADSEGEQADRELSAAQTFVIALCKIGRRFREVSGPKLVWDSWRTYDKRQNPSDHQLLQHAAQMVAGKVIPTATTTQPAPSQAALYKAWKLRKYQTDNALAIGIPEATLRAEYEQSMRVH